MNDGCTWEQVTAIQNNSYVFAEDALSDFASLIGMDTNNILLDSDSESDYKNTVVLHFKKAKEKKLTLNTAFVKVFGEILEPFGFVKVKSRHPYFVRLVGDEIIHVITIKEEWSGYPDEKRFSIYGGIATVYRNKIDFNLGMPDNKEWLRALFIFYSNISKKK